MFLNTCFEHEAVNAGVDGEDLYFIMQNSSVDGDMLREQIGIDTHFHNCKIIRKVLDLHHLIQ